MSHYQAFLHKRPSAIEKSLVVTPHPPDTTSSIGQPFYPRSSTSNTEVEALDCRASQQRRVLIPSRMQPMEDEQQRYPPSLTFSSFSTGTDSAVTTPAFGYFSSPEIKKSSIYVWYSSFKFSRSSFFDRGATVQILAMTRNCHERALSAGR